MCMYTTFYNRATNQPLLVGSIPSVFLWGSLFVLLVNEQDFVVDGSPEYLKALDVQLNLSFCVKVSSDDITAFHLGQRDTAKCKDHAGYD